MTEPSVLVGGIGFAEGPRWHDGRFWFSDFISRYVHTVDLDGRLEDVVEVPGVPSGLGWLPDGRLLVVSMQDRKLMRLEADGSLVEHADLHSLASYHCNDMVVDAAGRAYVGNFGFDFQGGEQPRATTLARVDPDGSTHLAADDVMFPNGTVITPDGRTLVVGETFAARLTAFEVSEDGALDGRRSFAQLDGGAVPDGICLDAEGAVWVASPTTNEVLRVRDGGEVVDRISTGSDGAYACMLGGQDRRTLLICAAAELQAAGTGKLLVAEVGVGGEGLP